MASKKNPAKIAAATNAASKKIASKKAHVKNTAAKKTDKKKITTKPATSKKAQAKKRTVKKSRASMVSHDLSRSGSSAFPITGDCMCRQKKPNGKFYFFQLIQGSWIQSSAVPFSSREVCEEVNCS